MTIRPEDIEISFFRSGGPGGQHKNVTESAVRIRHIPTGIVVISTAHRSQHRNREAALEELGRRLKARMRKPKPRRPTKPTKASKKRRIEVKKKRGETKRLRQRPGEE
jgi:protein subunit release factor A